ncbi:MAG TPA: asparaginase [Phycisphaerales bacterium]|nr:asparaginase [Phycisphaerales bacterium]
MRHITIITTGGTMEKVYDESIGSLVNRHSNIDYMLGHLRLEDTEVSTMELLQKDSLELTDADRGLIVLAAKSALSKPEIDGIVILHGTDTLSETGDRILADIQAPSAPIILTGAMRPFEMKKSDALQNLTESLFATTLLEPGVYAVFHGRVLQFPGVVKNRDRGTFEKVNQ